MNFFFQSIFGNIGYWFATVCKINKNRCIGLFANSTHVNFMNPINLLVREKKWKMHSYYNIKSIEILFDLSLFFFSFETRQSKIDLYNSSWYSEN